MRKKNAQNATGHPTGSVTLLTSSLKKHVFYN